MTNKVIIILLLSIVLTGCQSKVSKNYRSTPDKAMTRHTPSEKKCWQIYEKAKIAISKNDWVNGEKLCKKALAQLKETDPQHAFGAMKNNLVRPLLMNYKTIEALKTAKQALKINLSTKDHTGTTISYFNLADVYTHTDDIKNRKKSYQDALEFANKSGDKALIKSAKRRIKESQKTVKNKPIPNKIIKLLANQLNSESFLKKHHLKPLSQKIELINKNNFPKEIQGTYSVIKVVLKDKTEKEFKENGPRLTFESSKKVAYGNVCALDHIIIYHFDHVTALSCANTSNPPDTLWLYADGIIITIMEKNIIFMKKLKVK